MALFKNINNAGSGISKEKVRNKKGISGFFGIFGRKFWSLFRVNMLYMLFWIPLIPAIFFFRTAESVGFYAISAVCWLAFIFLAGPATGGMFKVIRSYCLESPIFLEYTFFKGFKKEYFRSSLGFAIDLVMILSVYSSFKIYPKYLGSSNFKYILLALNIFIAAMIFMMNFYYYLLNTATDLSLKDSIKDSFYLVTIGIKTNFMTAVYIILIGGIIGVLCYISGLYFLLFFLPAAWLCLIVTYRTYPFIQKYVINPYYRQTGEVNPELEYEYGKDVAIFEDMGGKEKPIVVDKKTRTRKRRAGKDIS